MKKKKHASYHGKVILFLTLKLYRKILRGKLLHIIKSDEIEVQTSGILRQKTIVKKFSKRF